MMYENVVSHSNLKVEKFIFIVMMMIVVVIVVNFMKIIAIDEQMKPMLFFSLFISEGQIIIIRIVLHIES